MKTIGVIGGLSWFSTIIYYRTINQLMNERLGESHSAKVLLYSVDFNEFKILQEKNDWDTMEQMLTGIAMVLQNAGADCIVMAANTPHLVADTMQKKITIPLLHIAEETGKEITTCGVDKVGLIGTRFTMENPFFIDRLARFGIETIVPGIIERDSIHHAIYNELTKGVFNDTTKKQFIEVIDNLRNNGAKGVIFGCTEISLLLNQDDCSIPVFDTAMIHSKAAVDFAVS